MVAFLRKNGGNSVKIRRKRSAALLFRGVVTILLLLPLALSIYRIIKLSQSRLTSDVLVVGCSDCGSGTCLVNRCICVQPSHTGKNCKDANPNYNAHSIACFKGNDDRCMNIPKYGRLKTLSQARTTNARNCEVSWWEHAHGIPIRNEQQRLAFGNFEALPVNLGNVLELGCGPYTKFKLILQEEAPKQRTVVDSVTLVDPLLDQYLANPNITTSFDRDKLCVKDTCIPVRLRSITGEALSGSDSDELYDTVILVNTLEHTDNAVSILHNIYGLLKPGGILIFGEEYATPFQLQVADPCHPIRIQRQLFDEYLTLFRENLLGPQTGMNVQGITHEGVKQSIYAIVRK